MGREFGEAAQVGVQAAVLAGQKGCPHVLHLQPGREAGGGWMSGRHHPDLGQKPQRESYNKHACTHTHTRTSGRHTVAEGCKHRMSVLLQRRVICPQGKEVKAQQFTERP